MRRGFPAERASMAARSAPRPGFSNWWRNRGASGARSTSELTSKRWKSGRPNSPPATSAMRPCCRNFWTRSRPIKRSSVTADGAFDTRKCHDAIHARQRRPRCRRHHSAPQERQTMEARYRWRCRPQRGHARITPRRSDDLATMERLSPPEPRRNLSRARRPSGGSFSRRMDARCQTAGSASGHAGL